MRMSDVFELPVSRDKLSIRDGVSCFASVLDPNAGWAIAHAINNHDALVEALEMLETTCSDIHIFDHPIRVHVREVIKQAKGE